MTPPDDLDELARKGRENLAGRDAREARRRDGYERFKAARHRLIAECSTTPLGWLGTGEVSMLAPLLIIAVACGLAGRNHPLVVQGAIGFHVALFMLLIVTRIQGKAGWTRETAWVASLPFPLRGYLPKLGDLGNRTFASRTSGPSTRLEMALQFQGDPPADVEGIVAGFDATLAVTKQGARGFSITRKDFPGGMTNFPLRRFVRRFAETVLLPLNSRVPLSRVDLNLKN